MTAVVTNGAHAPAEEVAVKAVALVGTATSSRDLVNEQPPEVEVWGLNMSYEWMPRWDRWFEMHDRTRYSFIEGDHLEWLKACDCPVYMAERYADIPQSVRYPIEHVTQEGRFRPLFTSSIAYMIAMAIAEGFTEIRFCGIDMSMDSEYAYQRAACEYWIGIAEALGITVVIPPSSPIGKAPLYGRQTSETDRLFRDWIDDFTAGRLSQYQTFITELYQKLDEFRMKSALQEGGINAVTMMRQRERGG